MDLDQSAGDKSDRGLVREPRRRTSEDEARSETKDFQLFSSSPSIFSVVVNNQVPITKLDDEFLVSPGSLFFSSPPKHSALAGYNMVSPRGGGSGEETSPRSEQDVSPRSESEASPRSGSEASPRSGSDASPRSGSKISPRSGSEASPRSGSDASPRSGSKISPRSGSEPDISPREPDTEGVPTIGFNASSELSKSEKIPRDSDSMNRLPSLPTLPLRVSRRRHPGQIVSHTYTDSDRNRKFKKSGSGTQPGKLLPNDRLSILRSLLKVSGRMISDKFKCYLDLGCGNGEIFKTNMKFLRPARGYCADLNNNHLPGFIPIVDNKIPLPDGHVDLITCHVAIHHFTHPHIMINEMARVMIPGGYLFIREHDVVPEEETDVTAYLDLLHMMEFIRHGMPITPEIQSSFYRRYWSRQDLTEMLCEFGFEEIGLQRYIKRCNPQRIYHGLYRFDPTLADQASGETTLVSKAVKYSLAKNNLVQWLKTGAKKCKSPEYIRSYYRWFCDTMRKKLRLRFKQLDRLVNQSRDDLDFYQMVFNLVHPEYDWSNQVNYSRAYIAPSGSVSSTSTKDPRPQRRRRRSNSFPENKSEINNREETPSTESVDRSQDDTNAAFTQPGMSESKDTNWRKPKGSDRVVSKSYGPNQMRHPKETVGDEHDISSINVPPDTLGPNSSRSESDSDGGWIIKTSRKNRGRGRRGRRGRGNRNVKYRGYHRGYRRNPHSHSDRSVNRERHPSSQSPNRTWNGDAGSATSYGYHHLSTQNKRGFGPDRRKPN